MSDASFDFYGRLRITAAPISMVGVSEYSGRVIGKNPDRTYRLLRPADELRKAARGFRSLPLLSRHVDKDEDFQDLIVGTIGTDVLLDDPYLLATVAIWSGDAVQSVLDGSRAALSASYSFDTDMTAGMFEGERHDGVMRDIVGHHVALVAESRAGESCRIKIDFEIAA